MIGFPPEAQQLLENIRAYAKYLEIDLLGLAFDHVDVAYQKPVGGIEAKMSEVIYAGDVRPLLLRLVRSQDFIAAPMPHPGYKVNFRQNVLRWSMQINLNLETGYASFDIDRWNPCRGWFVGALMHLGEVVYDKFAACDTDPRAVAAALRKKGLEVRDCFATKEE